MSIFFVILPMKFLFQTGECPLLKLEVQHRAYEIIASFFDVIFDGTQGVAKRYNFRGADMFFFGISKTCVSLFYEKLERSSK
jgi:hypothetical protein